MPRAACASEANQSTEFKFSIGNISGSAWGLKGNEGMAAWQKSSGTSLSTAAKIITADASIGSYNANSGTLTQGLGFVGMRHRS